MWTIPDRPGNVNVIPLEDNTLWIKKVKKQNRGYYECEGTDERGLKFYSLAVLKVLSKNLKLFFKDSFCIPITIDNNHSCLCIPFYVERVSYLIEYQLS